VISKHLCIACSDWDWSLVYSIWALSGR